MVREYESRVSRKYLRREVNKIEEDFASDTYSSDVGDSCFSD
ncbi:unnamed protein product [marine sediment metagenome]|uniref:Uncharacterized protein n=1 Tax=marine sediment metagenome TaxID=412755 RepID=X1D1E1_9ZZZZ